MTHSLDVDDRVVPLLELRGISLSFDGVHALSEVGFSLSAGEVLAIIGPNGAGKSSLLNVISGIYRAHSGSIRFNGELCSPGSPGEVARKRVARTFQNLALFRGMTVLENVLTGMSLQSSATLLERAFALPRARHEEARQREQALEVLEFLQLHEHLDTPVARLPYGLQKRVELGRALAAKPQLVLLDEPMAGMNFHEKVALSQVIVEINERLAITVVLIEHDMGVVMGISDRVVVLEYGRKIADAAPASVRSDPRVIEAYLGVAHAEPPSLAEAS